MLLFQYQMSEEKKQILDSLVAFVYRRTLINPEDYVGAEDSLKGDRATARSDLRDAKILLGAVRRRSWITEVDILKHANKRLLYDNRSHQWDYIVGQMFGTEYRGAVCALLSDTLAHCYMCQGMTREEVRHLLKKELGRVVVQRWL